MTRPTSASVSLPGADSEPAGPEASAPIEGRSVRAGHLYVVATPIGNLGDLSPRARDVLAGVDRIAAEDTRTTGAMLAHFGIRARLVALHDHNEGRIADGLIDELAAGKALALVSDAGTPLISDPGFTLVRAARAAGIPVVAVPGPCAAIAALSISGLPSDSFVFVGFLPAKAAARQRKLESLRCEPRTVIAYESSHRISDCLDDLVTVLGESKPVCLAREISKRFEESFSGSAALVRDWCAADPNRRRGEFVLVIEAAAIQTDEPEAERVLKLLLREVSPSAAARLAAEITGASRKALYASALRFGAATDDKRHPEDAE